MAKKKSTEAKQRTDLTKFCAFWSVAISAVMYICSGIIALVQKALNMLDGATGDALTRVCGILVFLGNIALVIAIGLPAHGYVRGKSKGWKVFYWIAMIVFALGIVFNVIPNLM